MFQSLEKQGRQVQVNRRVSAMLVMFASLLISAATFLIPVGFDASAEATIGVQRKWGFPVSFRRTAPGLAAARFDGTRFALNTAAWVLVLYAVRQRRTPGAPGSRPAAPADDRA